MSKYCKYEAEIPIQSENCERENEDGDNSIIRGIHEEYSSTAKIISLIERILQFGNEGKIRFSFGRGVEQMK